MTNSPTIDPAQLLVHLGEPGLLVVDTREESVWRQATIPGAASLQVYDYFIPDSGPAGVADMQAAVRAGLNAVGADRATTTVYFEEQTGMISPRGLWFHHYAGLRGGLVLDGGFAAWRAVGGPVAPGQSAPAAIRSGAPSGEGIFNAAVFATIDEVRGHDPARTDILDVRRRSEHDGSFVHPCCARPGRIPGSRFLFWEDLLENGAYRAPEDISARAQAAGLSPERDIIAYCHRGARAATAAYALRLAGFAHVRVFVGSWHEWADRADLPADIR